MSSFDTGCQVLHRQNTRKHPTDSRVSQSGSPCIVTGGHFLEQHLNMGIAYPVLRLDSPVSRLGQLQYGAQHIYFFLQVHAYNLTCTPRQHVLQNIFQL